MADLSQTAANVVAVASMRRETVIAGDTITQGMGVFRLSNDGRWYKSQANLEASAPLHGVSLTAASAGQDLVVGVGPGNVNLGATLSVGKIYVTSSGTSGQWRPVDDVTAGDFVSVGGVAISSSLLMFNPISSGVAAAANVT